MTNQTILILTSALVSALRRLAEAGEAIAASELAARTYANLRHDEPRVAERLNGVMHHLARLEVAAPHDEGSLSMADDFILDVRSEPPVRRHTVIFDTFARLGVGEAFVLVNDHDPKPLYYQLAAEQGGTFTWEYLEQGPTDWRVRVGRTAAAEPAERGDQLQMAETRKAGS